MYCRYCGKQIDDNAVVCPHCGILTNEPSEQKSAPQQPYQNAQPYQPQQPAPRPASQEMNVLALVGFILSFFVCLAGLICSCIGLKKAKEMGGSGKGFAIAGIAISATVLGIIFIYICAFCCTLCIML